VNSYKKINGLDLNQQFYGFYVHKGNND